MSTSEDAPKGEFNHTQFFPSNDNHAQNTRLYNEEDVAHNIQSHRPTSILSWPFKIELQIMCNDDDDDDDDNEDDDDDDTPTRRMLYHPVLN